MLILIAIAPAWPQKLDLKFDSRAAKACDKPEIDLHGRVLATIVKSLSR
jgi:hypothetical protein